MTSSIREDTEGFPERDRSSTPFMASNTCPQERNRGRSVSESPVQEQGAKRAYTKLLVDDDVEAEVVAWAKRQRPRALTREEKIDVVLLQAKLRNEERNEREKDGRGRKKRAAKVSSRVAHLLGRKHVLVQQAWAEYVAEKKVSVTLGTGNTVAHAQNIPDTRKLTSELQVFVRERRLHRQRTVAKDVMVFLHKEGYLGYNENDRTSVASALRCVQRFLVKKGYRRGKKKGSQNYRLKEDILVKRNQYARRMMEENESGQRRIVYMDESYIHHHYSRHEDSLYDPNDEQDLAVKAQHKGRRYCFIAAIIDADRSVPEAERNEAQKAALLRDTLDIFEGGKKQTKDYHGMFDSNYFILWMKKLLDSLAAENVSNSIIVMDNAKYHKTLPTDTPRKGWRKAQLIDAACSYGITVESKMTKPEIWSLLEEHIAKNVVPTICEMARRAGHEVLFSPPHYSDLQPIETVWAITKGTVGRAYTTQTKFPDVLERLRRAFSNLQPSTVQSCINKANQQLEKLHEAILKEDAVDLEDIDEDDDEERNEGDLDDSDSNEEQMDAGSASNSE